MAAGAEVRIEESMGIDRCVMKTVTRQSLTEKVDKNENARSYREDHTDGVYTLVEEILLSQGEPQFSFDGSIGTEPIETHPVFNAGGNLQITEELKKRWTTYKRNPSDAFLAGKGTGRTNDNPLNLWQPATETNSNFARFYDYIKEGVESYYVGRVTVRVTVLENGAPDMSNLGKIDQWASWPSGFTPPPGSNFILSGVRSQQEGDFFRTTYEYTSSAAGTAWDTTLYQES
jgi:hypothetical protein